MSILSFELVYYAFVCCAACLAVVVVFIVLPELLAPRFWAPFFVIAPVCLGLLLFFCTEPVQDVLGRHFNPVMYRAVAEMPLYHEDVTEFERLTPDEVEQRTHELVARMNDRSVSSRNDFGGRLHAYGLMLHATIRYLGDGIFIIANHHADHGLTAEEALIDVAKSFPTYRGHFIVRTDKPKLNLSYEPSEWPEVICSDPSKTLTTRVKRLVIGKSGFLIPSEEGLAEYERLNARYRK